MRRQAGDRNVSNWRTLQAAVVAIGATTLIAAASLGGGFGPAAPRDDPVAASGALLTASSADIEVHYHPGRPAHIHDGTCEDLGEVAFALNPVGAGTMTGAAMTDVPAMDIGSPAGPSSAKPVEVGRITLGVPLDEIASGNYALNVQISQFEYGNSIACGDVGGVVNDGTLAFGLAPREGSGFSGLALLKDEGRKTRVTVFLAEGLENEVVLEEQRMRTRF